MRKNTRNGGRENAGKSKIQNVQNNHGTEDPREDEPGRGPGAEDPGGDDLRIAVCDLLAVRGVCGDGVRDD